MVSSRNAATAVTGNGMADGGRRMADDGGGGRATRRPMSGQRRWTARPSIDATPAADRSPTDRLGSLSSAMDASAGRRRITTVPAWHRSDPTRTTASSHMLYFLFPPWNWSFFSSFVIFSFASLFSLLSFIFFTFQMNVAFHQPGSWRPISFFFK